jgi:hypothetical protein
MRHPGMDMDSVRSVALKVARRHAQMYLSALGPSLTSNLEVAGYIDQMMLGAVLQLRTKMLQGESSDETKSVSKEFQFDVFATWTDHLKYDIREGRVMGWLPKRWTRRLAVRYQKIVKKESMEVPVKMTRMCPHAATEFHSDYHHAYFLIPTELGVRP